MVATFPDHSSPPRLLLLRDIALCMLGATLLLWLLGAILATASLHGNLTRAQFQDRPTDGWSPATTFESRPADDVWVSESWWGTCHEANWSSPSRIPGRQRIVHDEHVYQWGWPLRVFSSRRVSTENAAGHLVAAWNGCLVLGDPIRPYLLPINPLWRGWIPALAVTTMILFGVQRGTKHLLRRLRGKHSCSGCGYSLSGLGAATNCPECGRDR